MLTDVYNIDEPHYGKTKFRIGQNVRISKYKHVFEKGYTPNWTTEIFKIFKIQPTNPETYILIDSMNQPIKGGFYKKSYNVLRIQHYIWLRKLLREKATNVLLNG